MINRKIPTLKVTHPINHSKRYACLTTSLHIGDVHHNVLKHEQEAYYGYNKTFTR